MPNAVRGKGLQQRQQQRRLPERSGSGWEDAWDSSSDPEDNINSRSGRHSSANPSNTGSGLAPANTAPIAVPIVKNPMQTTALDTRLEDNIDRDTAPARSSSYAHVSPPSSSSYGPRTDWTVLDKTEITEAEKAYEAQRDARLRQVLASSPVEAGEQTHDGSAVIPGPKLGIISLPSKSFSSGVAGLSKSFMSIALGSPQSSSSSLRYPSGKGKDKEVTAIPVEQAPCTPSKKQVYGRNAIRSDIDEILRGQSSHLSAAVRNQLINILPTDPLHILKEWGCPLPPGPDRDVTANSADTSANMPQPQGGDIGYSSVAQNVTQSKGLGRAKSLRTERRREKFAKVLSGKVKDRSVDSGEPGAF